LAPVDCLLLIPASHYLKTAQVFQSQRLLPALLLPDYVPGPGLVAGRANLTAHWSLPIKVQLNDHFVIIEI